MGNERQNRPPTAEEIAEWHDHDRMCRVSWMPPQIDEEGKIRLCVNCKSPLHPLENRNYDGAMGGFCNKLCGRGYEKKLMNEENFSGEEAGHELDKYEAYKPPRQEVLV